MPDDQDTPTPEDLTPEDASEQPEPSEPAESTDSTEEPVAGADDASDTDDAESDASSDAEAAALAAAMAAINQVQGVADSVSEAPSDNTQPFAAPEFGDSISDAAKSEIELLSDVHMDVRIELGRTRMFVEDVLKLGDGAVVELDKLAGDPVDVFVNDRRVARGEVLVLNDMFCVRISEVMDITQSED